MIDDDTLFSVSANLGPFTPEQRAAATNEKLRSIIKKGEIDSIGYDTPWKQIHAFLIAAAKVTDNILKDPNPYVLQTSLDAFYVSYELNAYTDQPNIMAQTYSDLHQNIQDKFNEAGIEIMSPHYSSVREGNQTAIPEAYLPRSYQAPALWHN